ncbi:MAG: ion transporter [Burkholderiaceae bacterium]
MLSGAGRASRPETEISEESTRRKPRTWTIVRSAVTVHKPRDYQPRGRSSSTILLGVTGCKGVLPWITLATRPRGENMDLNLGTDAKSIRGRLAALIGSRRFRATILTLIVVNAVTLGLQTSPAVMDQVGAALNLLDRMILAVFVAEIAIRLYVHRLAFFRDPWSVFDLFVIGLALVPAGAQISVLRALRILRVLRVITVAPSMRRVVGALLEAIPGLGSIALVLMLIVYVFAVIATHLFGADFPDWFGHVGRSLYSLFQVMTLESWSMGISRPVMQVFPYAWAFFVPFILIATFTMLNLFIAVIVSATQNYSDEQHQDTREARDDAHDRIEGDLHAELRSLRAEIAELKAVLALAAQRR